MTRMVILGKRSELKSDAFAYTVVDQLTPCVPCQLIKNPCEAIRWHHRTVLAIIGALPNKCDARDTEVARSTVT
jgi:hypothetical protein